MVPGLAPHQKRRAHKPKESPEQQGYEVTTRVDNFYLCRFASGDTSHCSVRGRRGFRCRRL